MSCTLTLGRLLPCRDVVGGINRIWFVNYSTMGDLTIAGTDELTANGTPFTAYEYEVKGANSLEQTITASRENGTVFFEQVLTVTFPKMDLAMNKEVKLMAYGRPHIFVEDYNGNVFTAGADNGMDVTGGSYSSGAAMGDLNGYSLTFTGSEKLPANFVDTTAATEANPFTIINATNTVVVGS